jgi:hypothetical protein
VRVSRLGILLLAVWILVNVPVSAAAGASWSPMHQCQAANVLVDKAGKSLCSMSGKTTEAELTHHLG